MTVQQEIERYRKDALYFEENREEFLRLYPERWVAVYEQKMVGVAKHLPQLINSLKKKGLPSNHTFIEYLSTNEATLILSSL
ncbi:MAG: hypothetical protein HW403_1324 [Dehalococcoidia bacterium]|nr:hypothetical protein [Dehalococcoidia bacterium]